jgi:hypothetical protein
MTLTREQHREAMYGLCIAHVTSPAENRMRMRTAREQHAAALAELNREQDQTRNDDEDDSSLRNNVLR